MARYNPLDVDSRLSHLSAFHWYGARHRPIASQAVVLPVVLHACAFSGDPKAF